MSYYDQNIHLFYKIIASLYCIEKITSDNVIREQARVFNQNIIEQYQKYIIKKSINTLEFKYSENEITAFSNECYEKIDIIEFAEDLEFGFSDLMKNILKERNNQ